VSSKQQVGEPLFESIEFDDTAELNINDTAETTINRNVVNELFPDHSSSVINPFKVSFFFLFQCSQGCIVLAEMVKTAVFVKFGGRG